MKTEEREKSWIKKVENPGKLKSEGKILAKKRLKSLENWRERDITFVPGKVVSIAEPYSAHNGDSNDNDHLTMIT